MFITDHVSWSLNQATGQTCQVRDVLVSMVTLGHTEKLRVLQTRCYTCNLLIASLNALVLSYGSKVIELG